MRKWGIVLILGIVLTFTACSGMRESIIDLSESDFKNVEALKEAAGNLLKTWPFYSGLIQGAIDFSNLPESVVTAMAELDEIAKETKPTDERLGYSLGLRVKMLSGLVKEALEQYAPDVLELVPLLL